MEDMAVTESVPSLPFERPSLLAPPPLLLRLQGERPVTRVRTVTGDVGWLVSGYERVRDLLGDDRLGRAHRDPENAPRFSHSAFGGGPNGTFDTELADHTRMRRVLTRSFMVKRMNALRPAIQALVNDLLDRMAASAPPADLHEALSMPLPVLVICELLGVPYEDRADFRRWSDDSTSMLDPQRAASGMQQLGAYMAGHVARRREQRGEDVISDLLTASEEEGEAMPEQEVIELGAGLLFAGHETTMARLDFGALLLMTHPEERRLIERDPAAVDAAVEEILRFSTVDTGVMARYARDDIELEGVTIRAGELVLLGMGAANRDDAQFPEPDRFDVRRAQNHHVTFGHGNRFCLGAGLARIELRTGLGTLFQRFPTLELAVPLDEVRLRDDIVTGGLAALPVTW
jgi:pentalenolactone synthase